jgi:hypothetical protein
MASLIAFLIAGALLVSAVVPLVRERALRRRLLPIEAKLLKGGDRLEFSETTMQAEARAGLQDSALPAQPDSGFHARWSYAVGGKAYEAEIAMSSPVFRKEDVRFGRVQVFYDPANPALSVPRPGAADQAWAWFVAAGVVAVVGLVMHIIAAA